MKWDFIARGADVLSTETGSIEAELHALRSGLAIFFALLAEEAAVSPSGMPRP